MRYIAPAGTPIRFSDIVKCIYDVVAKDDMVECFRQEIRRTFGARHCFFLSTGRAALCALLRSLVRLGGNDKNEVVIPSYTCFSVPSSVAKAGLKIRLCDIDPGTLDYDLQKLSQIDFANVLGIVASNLYGIPNDLKQISIIAKHNNVFLIDDCAQCMGGKVDGRFSGTLGDAGLYSLDKGKNITSMDGGILVTDSDELASCIRAEMRNLPDTTVGERTLYTAKLLLYSIFLRPNLYWLPCRLPFLKLGATVYTTEYHIGSYDGLRASLAVRLLQRIDEITAHRVQNGSYLREHLTGFPFLRLPHFRDYVTPVYLRYPVLVRGSKLRNGIVTELNSKGIGATASYPTSIDEINEIQDIVVNKHLEFVGGKRVAEEIITLPTHPYVAEGDLAETVSVIRKIAELHI